MRILTATIILLLSAIFSSGCNHCSKSEQKQVVKSDTSIAIKVYDCNYKCPHQWSVRQRVTGKYVLLFMHIDQFQYFLGKSDRANRFEEWPDREMALEFDDSCEAKQTLKEYLEQKNQADLKYNLK